MEITCWGSRGSIPVFGPDYLQYGGDTTCIEIKTASDDIVIIDAGTGIRRLGNQLIESGRFRYHIIFTHAHWDHLMGFPFFKPLYLSRSQILMRRCPFDSKFVKTVLSRVMSPPYFPVHLADVSARIDYLDACPSEFEIGSMRIKPIPLSHPDRGSGYRFTEDDKSFVFLTDNELRYIHSGGCDMRAYADFSSEADLLIHDAEYTPDEYKKSIGWGHSSYTDAVKLSLACHAKRLGLFHLNQDRTDKQMDDIVSDCRRQIDEADGGVECFGVAADMTIRL